MPTVWAFDYIENKHSLYSEQDCVKRFFSSLKGHNTNITDFENNNPKL